MAKPLPYPTVREALLAGDVLLFRSRGLFSRVIRWTGRSRYSHAAVIVLLWGRVFVAESREFRGCRLVPLSAAVGHSHVDLYRVSGAQESHRRALVQEALRRIAQPYGWLSILRMAAARLPIRWVRSLPLVGRLFGKVRLWSEDDELPPGQSLVCSAYVSACWRAAGVDLVRRLADSSTEPGDIARSARLDLLGALTPHEGVA